MKGFPSGVWTEKWKVLRELDSSSSLAAIVLSRNRDLSNQTQTCVTATLEVHEEEKTTTTATCKNMVQTTLEDTTHFHRFHRVQQLLGDVRATLQFGTDGALG